MSKTRLLLLTQWFDPEPTFKGLVFARELVHQGFDVEVLTGFPNYPGGILYAGYQIKFLQREFIDGVRVTRVPLFPSHDHSVFGRIFNYISFSFSATLYAVFAARSPSVVYAYHPPLTVGLAAILIKFFRKCAVVYDVQDMWPDTLSATGMLNSVFILNVVSWFCSFVYSFVDHIVVLSPGFKRLLIRRGVPSSKISVIYNWADEQSLLDPIGFLHPTFPVSNNHFRILFAGNIGKAQSLRTVLDAASLTQMRNSSVQWLLLGDGLEVDVLKSDVKRMNLNNVLFFPSVPMSEVGLYLREADALLVHLRRDPLFEITIPSKTQAYMAVGKPLLMAVNGDAADLVRLSSGGVVSDSDNPESLADAAHYLSSLSKQNLLAMAVNSRNFYRSNLELTCGVRHFAEIFHRFGV